MNKLDKPLAHITVYTTTALKGWTVLNVLEDAIEVVCHVFASPTAPAESRDYVRQIAHKTREILATDRKHLALADALN